MGIKDKLMALIPVGRKPREKTAEELRREEVMRGLGRLPMDIEGSMVSARKDMGTNAATQVFFDPGSGVVVQETRNTAWYAVPEFPAASAQQMVGAKQEIDPMKNQVEYEEIFAASGFGNGTSGSISVRRGDSKFFRPPKND